MGLCAAEENGIDNVGLLYSKRRARKKGGEKTRHYILRNGPGGGKGERCEYYAETGREHEVLPER